MNRKASWVAAIRGYVWVKLVGGQSETFLNGATESRIQLWSIAFTPEGHLTFGVSLPDFFRLRPLARRSGGKLRVLRRFGLPFQLNRLSRRKTFAAGMALFVVGLFALSSLVWNVRIEGNSAVPKETVLAAARDAGLFRFQWTFKLPTSAELAQRLAVGLPESAWVGVEKRGTSVTITVIDSTKPEQQPPSGPSHLVSLYDAVVTRVVAESGRPKVERNDRVRKNQVLVSGWLGDGAARTKAVPSKGKVMGLVWHEYRIVSPLTRAVDRLTGESQERSYLTIGDRALQYAGYGGPEYERSETTSTFRRLTLAGWTLPIGIWKEKEMEAERATRQLTPEEAKREGLAAARAELLAKCGPDARITAENLLHEHTENGKVVMTVVFEVEQSIAVERPLQ